MMRLRWLSLLLCTALILAACSKPSELLPEDPTPGLDPNPGEEYSNIKPTEPSFPVTQLLPADESGLDPSFAAYWADLKRAVEMKDPHHLVGLLDIHIKNGFGGDDGVGAFKEQWDLNRNGDVSDSALWPILDAILKMGGTFRNDERTMFAAPYVYTRFPGDHVDEFQHLVIVGEDVPVRVEPRSDAGAIARVSHLIVRIKHYREHEEWAQIVLPTGQVGYVAAASVWSPIGWRAGFHKTPDGWKMSFLAAGD